MLNVDQVLEYLEKYLANRGCRTKSHGIDLRVRRENGIEISIEAKGNTSSKIGSKRYGLNFNDSQCHDHFSRAFFRAVEMKDKIQSEYSKISRVAMAFGYLGFYKKYADPIRPTLADLEIGVFWIHEDGRIIFESSWDC
jgi:hypothetical protein